jgi:hypothetical protein
LGGWYKNEFGEYVFGSDEINGKFPNQNAFSVGTRTDLVTVRVSEDDEGETVLDTQIEQGAPALADRAAILLGDNT